VKVGPGSEILLRACDNSKHVTGPEILKRRNNTFN